MDTITINLHNATLNRHLEGFIHEKLGKLHRYLPNIASITVDISQQKSNRGPDMVSAQITIRHSRGAIFRAEEKAAIIDNNTLKIVINDAVEKMYRRITRFKGKRRDKRDRNPYKATLEEFETLEELDTLEMEINEAPDAEQQEPLIYRRKVIEVAPMTEEEAIEQMELLGHSFFVFYHAERQRINVLYKRSNGGYGVLDPKIG